MLRAAEAAGVGTVVVASTDKAALAASFYGRTKRFMEQLTAYSAREGGGHRCAVRLVNVLGSAGSASELFLRQARAGVPLTVTDTGMMRFWITGAHAALVLAHGALLAADGEVLSTPHDPAELSVGELAQRIWRAAGAGETADIELLGIRRGETLTEVLTGPGETLGGEARQGIAAITGGPPSAGPAWVAERLEASMGREAARGRLARGDAPPRACSSLRSVAALGRIRTRRTGDVGVTAPRRSAGACRFIGDDDLPPHDQPDARRPRRSSTALGLVRQAAGGPTAARAPREAADPRPTRAAPHHHHHRESQCTRSATTLTPTPSLQTACGPSRAA